MFLIRKFITQKQLKTEIKFRTCFLMMAKNVWGNSKPYLNSCQNVGRLKYCLAILTKASVQMKIFLGTQFVEKHLMSVFSISISSNFQINWKTTYLPTFELFGDYPR